MTQTTISYDADRLLESLADKTWLASQARGLDPVAAAALMADGAPAAQRQAEEALAAAWAQACALMGEWATAANGGYRVELAMPANWPEAMRGPLEQALLRLVACGAAAKWWAVAKPDEAKTWENAAKDAAADLVACLHRRVPPVRKPRNQKPS